MQLKKLSWIWLWLLAILLACRVPNAPQTSEPVPSPGEQVTEPPMQLTDEGTATPVATLVSSDNEAENPDQERYERIFRFVWNTVERTYIYEDYNGVDWLETKRVYTPLIQKAPDDETFWLLMAEIINSLNDDHSSFLNPREVIEEDLAVQGNLDYTGIGIFVGLGKTDAYGVVLFTFPGSPAEASGLLAHDKILAVNGHEVCCGLESFNVLDLLLGEAGSTVNVVAQSPGQESREIIVERQRIQTQLPVLTEIYTPDAGITIGYVMLPTLWDDTIGTRTREKLQELFAATPLDALILDLRVNGGGKFTELEDILSIFTQGSMGAFKERGRMTYELVIMPDPVDDSQDIPLVVLIGDGTESFAEVLAGTLEEAGRATLVGRATAGNVETLYPYDLEDGSRLWIAQESFFPPSGTRWEGVGVQPNVHVEAAWEDFTETDDPYIQAAIDYLLQNELP